MENLTGKTIVIGGGTGDIGVEIVAEFTEGGANVIVPTRSPEKAETLRNNLDHPDRLTVIEEALDDDASIEKVRGILKDHGPLDGAVASLGSWFAFGPFAETEIAEIQTAFESLLRSHMIFARTVAPLLKGGSYVMINGGASKEPAPDSSIVSIMTRGLTMLPTVLQSEHPALRIHTLLLDSFIATRSRKDPDPSWITAREVGAAAAWFFSPIGELTAGSTVTLSSRS